MFDLLWLVPALPLAGFLLLIGSGHRLSRMMASIVGVGSVGLSALTALLIGFSFLRSPPPASAYVQTLWQWLEVANLAAEIALRLDALSLLMVLVVTVVGFLIHLYSVDYLADDEGYRRFFAYMNLFVSAMLTLVLADNLLLLLLGWEGVGLCSYLLIGFWYRDPANGRAARKAFVVTRIGDTALLVGVFLLFNTFGTLRITELMTAAVEGWPVGTGLAALASLLLLGGALGKSAQLPLQVWLPDAMAGPTPVSALIHAATMVTAGVYLIARTHALFELAPSVMALAAVIGAATLVYASTSALAQTDIKRALAYSTISQIGYMFLALGVGAWSAAIFHLMTHAFFKSLLFLSAGVVILAFRHEQNLFRMGGLRHRQPLAFWTFLAGASSLSAVPLLTAGFFSKELILLEAWSSHLGGPWLWAAGTVGAFLTALYSFRILFLAFFGEASSEQDAAYRPGSAAILPLLILAALSLLAGFVEIPPMLGDVPALSLFLRSSFPEAQALSIPVGVELLLTAFSSLAALAGIYLAYRIYAMQRRQRMSTAKSDLAPNTRGFLRGGWAFDRVYDTLIVRPYVWLASRGKDDIVDRLYAALAGVVGQLYVWLSATATGRVRWYATGISIGAVGLVAMGLLA